MERRILLIDDELFFRRLMSDSLNEAGFDVTAVISGDEAFKVMHDEKFGLVISDAILPGMDGFEICRKVKETKPELPVLIVSALYKSMDHRKIAIDECGAEDLLSKPVNIPWLIKKIEAIFQRSKETHPSTGGDTRLIKGILNEEFLPAILHSIALGKLTGRLDVSKGKIRTRVFFKDGYPHYAESNLLSTCLGKLLVKTGKISESVCDTSALRAKVEKKPQGELLVEMGAITNADIKRALSFQLKENLLNLFSLKEGEFSFIRGKNPKVEEVPLKMSVAQITLEGVRLHFTIDRLKKELFPLLDRYVALSSNSIYRFQDITLTREEDALIFLADGRKKLRNILNESGAPPSKDALRLFYSLIVSEMLETSEEPLKNEGQKTIEGKEKEVAKSGVEAVRQKLIKDASAADAIDYYRMLGLKRNFDMDALKKTFNTLARRYHPDKFKDYSCPIIQEKSMYITKKMFLAYRTLSDENTRNRYDAYLNDHSAKKS